MSNNSLFDNGSCVLTHVASNQTCEYIKINAGACEGGGFIPYSQVLYCDPHLFGLYCFLFVVLLILLFIGLSISADSFFCPCLAVIVEQLKISQNIAGVTFLAFGNGAPDIFSSIASVLSASEPKPGLAFGALMGKLEVKEFHDT